MKRVLLVISGFIIIGALILVFQLNSHSGNNLKDSDFVLLKSQVSPNKEFQFYEYQFDNGGFGYSRVYWAVIENDSNIFELDDGLLPDGYRIVGWTDNSELLIEKWEPYYYKDTVVDLESGNLFNGVKLILVE